MNPEYRRPGLRLSVDEAPDLALVRRVFMHFQGQAFSTLEALRWLERHPEVEGLNRLVQESRDNRDCRELSRSRRVPNVGRWP